MTETKTRQEKSDFLFFSHSGGEEEAAAVAAHE